MTDYKATPAQWQQIENSQVFNGSFQACVLELRSRVEALEASTKATSNSDQIRSSLVERVVEVLDEHHVVGALDESWHQQARAAIDEIAKWLTEHAGGTRAAWLLERELER